MSFLTDVRTQFSTKPLLPTTLFTSKTLIVTGSNTGLGKEVVRHFVRLDASKIIMAVRSMSKGLAAKAEIEASAHRNGIIEVWECDYSRYESVKAFAARVAGLQRVDGVLLNAGIATEEFERFEGMESTIAVNVISTMLLAVLVLPTLRKSAENWGSEPVISIVSSGVHAYTDFPERKTPNVFDTLNNEKNSRMRDRYPVSKLLQLLAARAMADTTAHASPFVVINTLNPGLCYTDLTRHAKGTTAIAMKALRFMMAWTAEEGSRTLVHAMIAGRDSHGIFLNGAQVENKALASWVTGADGLEAQKMVWRQLGQRLEEIQPGLMATI